MTKLEKKKKGSNHHDFGTNYVQENILLRLELTGIVVSKKREC